MGAFRTCTHTERLLARDPRHALYELAAVLATVAEAGDPLALDRSDGRPARDRSRAWLASASRFVAEGCDGRTVHGHEALSR